MGFIYKKAYEKFMQGELDLATDDIRIMLVMSSTTADTEEEEEFIDDFTTLDELDSANYARKICTSKAVTEDLPNDRTYFTSDGVTWSTLNPATRQVAGMIVFKLVNDDTDSIPIAYLDNSEAFPFVPDNNNVTLNPWSVADLEGWFAIKKAA